MPAYRILITGGNSGLGFATCCRLIDEFLAIRQSPGSLHLIFTTRDRRKCDDTLQRLQQHVQKTISSVYGHDPKTASVRELQRNRIELEGELTDLCSLRTVHDLTQRLLARKLHFDVVILNAGIGGWNGLNWPLAIWRMSTNLVEATTLGDFNRGFVGRTASRQILDKDVSAPEEPPLGETFTANVFGHYCLVHWLAPLLSSPSSSQASRVIWISSITSFPEYLSMKDLQALTTDKSYESTKRLSDVLVLSSELPATQASISHFVPVADNKFQRPRFYISHPGVCATNIEHISPWLVIFKVMTMYFVRLLGSPWHTVSPYVGSVATVWLALASKDTLENLEGKEGKGKWGASTDRMGNERVVRTEVDQWGFSGRAGEEADGWWRMGARKGKEKKVTKEELAAFEEEGAEAWAAMEQLRTEWEKRLGIQE